MPALLLSLKPRYAAAIFDGRKRFEFRRLAPRCAAPIAAYVYETMPCGRVTGSVTVTRIVTGSEAELLALLAPDDPLLADYRAYLAGARRPCALALARPVRFAAARPLAALLGAGARPPQSFCYVGGDGA
ncbi:MAG: hypothetical protein WDN08_16210 [Rhizomicrobium sp.]